MDPGAGLPDHEHVLIEQTYMIEGRLVDQEGPDKGIEAGPAISSGGRRAAGIRSRRRRVRS
jgi:anti-sigma factor ChrR (cupin superfamily)